MGNGVADELSEQMKRDGVDLPDNIAQQPKLASNLLGYLDAFYDLDTERNHGNGLMRIPWSRITAYGEHYGHDLEELHFFVRRMDDALLEQMTKERGNGGSTGPGTTVQRPPRPD